MAGQAPILSKALLPPPSLEACRLFCRDHFPPFFWPLKEERCRQSAVLVVLYPQEGDLRMILLLRPTHLRRHGGEIGFPGGAREQGDGTPVDTALREAFEEIGLERSSVDILGLLPREFAYGSDFCIVPVLAWYPFEGGPPLKLDPVEVDVVLTPRVSDLDGASLMEWREGEGRALLYPVFPLGQRRLWGASGRIALRLLRLISRLEEDFSCPS